MSRYSLYTNGKDSLAILERDAQVISDATTMAELLMELIFVHGIDRLVIDADQLSPDFFRLSTGLAGDITQKFSNHRAYLAIIGDPTAYTGKALQDYIRESNRSGQIVFAANLEEACAFWKIPHQFALISAL